MKKRYISLIVGMLFLVLFLVFLEGNLRNLGVIVVIIIIFIPFIVGYVKEIRKQRDKEERFLEFIRDIVENVKSGTPISKSIINLKSRDYGSLTEHIRKLSNQISLGIPLTKAFETFATETKSPVISRSISLISEANRSGGEIDTILNSVANSVNQTEIIKKERRASIFNLIVQGYIIFFVFIIIVLVLEFFLMPMVENLGPISDLNVDVQAKPTTDISQAIFWLLIVQSFFSGLVIGKISEGKITTGIKHSFILTSLALILFSLAKVIFG